MAHVERAEAVLALQEQVDPDFISWDDGSRGEWANGSEIWHRLADEPTDWSVVLQDDAQPVDNFREHVAAMLDRAPLTAVGLYVGTCRPRAMQVLVAVEKARELDAAWLEADTLLWGVGVALPTAAIPPMLEWADRMDTAYDQRIGQWFRRQGIPVRYTWPSLVDHTDGPSMIRHRPRDCVRVAHEVGIPRSINETPVRILDRGARIR